MAKVHALAMTVPAPWAEADFLALGAAKSTFVVSGGKAGFALGRIILDEVELLTLAVLPTEQGKGHGRALLAAFETEAMHRGGRDLHLEVAETNSIARALYASAGWAEVGRRKAYYKGGDARIDAILMSKQVVSA
ncbi:MAG: GNAT family N-acetyltransferase [Paracoccaceae bacterium]